MKMKAYDIYKRTLSLMFEGEGEDKAFKNNDFVDTAYFEPFYLKNFVPGMPKVKGLE